jgi:hypothetical protein
MSIHDWGATEWGLLSVMVLFTLAVAVAAVWTFTEAPESNRSYTITLRHPDRSALQSVVHYVQPEAAPDWTFINCSMREGLWTAEGERLA